MNQFIINLEILKIYFVFVFLSTFLIIKDSFVLAIPDMINFQ